MDFALGMKAALATAVMFYIVCLVLRSCPLMQLGLADRDSQSKQNANDMEKYCLSFIWFFFYFS